MPESKRPRKKRTATTAKPRTLPKLPDRRAMESVLAMFSGSDRDATLQEAQEVMYGAWDASSRQARVALARKALRISPLCADAYVLLAEETASTLSEATELYAKGVEVGEMALGADAFEDDVGHFWGLLETRPYMRARAGLAQALWAAGERAEAIGHYRDMLRLNPNDNQGLRYLLAAGLLTTGDDDGLATLLQDHDEDGSAAWLYTHALLAFRTSGASPRAAKLLAEAWRVNPHVPAYLMGRKKLPRRAPEFITWGGDDEAVTYVQDFGAGWHATPGALLWLADMVAKLPPAKKSGARTRR